MAGPAACSINPQRHLKIVQLADQRAHAVAPRLFLDSAQMRVDRIEAHCALARILRRRHAGLQCARDIGSTAHLDASDSGTYYKLGVGFEVTAGPMKSHLMFGYENMPAVPVIVRDGNNPSQLTFGDSDAWSVKFGVSVGFGGVPGNYRF